jgi:glycosyltransferase involved in cell wall biosynthesis
VEPGFYPSTTPIDHGLAEKFEEHRNFDVLRTKMSAGVGRILEFLRVPGVKKRKTSLVKSSGTQSQKNISGRSGNWQRFKDFITISLMIPDKHNRWFLPGVMAATKAVKQREIELVYAHGGPWTALLIGAFVKKITRLPLVVDFRDPWTDNPYEELHSVVRSAFNKRLERWVVTTADYVIANTDALKELFIRKYPHLSEEKFITITNGYDEDDYIGIGEHNDKAGNGPVTIVHTGTLYSKRSPLPFLKVVTELIKAGAIRKNEISIALIGKVDIPRMELFLKENGLENIVVLPGQISRQEALAEVFSADILLLLQQGTELQIPGKLFEYIRSGKPIFAVCDVGATRDMITSNELGVAADADDPEDIKEKFEKLFAAVRTIKRSGEAPANFHSQAAASFSSYVQTERLVAVFSRAVND